MLNNLFFYGQAAGGSSTGPSYSKIPQHTWKAKELIRNKHWNNLLAPPIFKKVTRTTGTNNQVVYNIGYEEAMRLLLNGDCLFEVIDNVNGNTTEHYICYIHLSNIENNTYNNLSGYTWISINGYLGFLPPEFTT